jgi:hypothetical protein
MPQMLCQARLTNYHKSKVKFGTQTRWNATYLKLCENEATPGTELCERCSKRPAFARNQITMIHGKLSEEIPYTSRIYGGKWYWDMVEKYGEPLDREWLRCAREAQLEGEKRAGAKAWRIVGGGPIEAKGVDEAKAATKPEAAPQLKIRVPKDNEMPPASSQAAKAPRGRKKKEVAPAAPAQSQAPTPVATLTPKSPDLRKHLYKITSYYEESDKQPKKLPTDTMKIELEEVDGKVVWVSKGGFMFENEDGEIGRFLGKQS